jgi:D-serine deaminase-like pyridoxal phosphate-dependent protein
VMDRRTLLAAAVGAPAIIHGSTEKRGHSYSEVERLLAKGDVKGKLTREDLPTPALLLDMDAFEFNVAKMTKYCKDHDRALRPHGKSHKCPEIAKALMRAGAGGACAAKLSEAEVFAANGVSGLLITTAVVGRQKIERAVRLAQHSRDTIFCADNAQNVRDLNEAAGAAHIRMNVVIELFIGGRSGIQPGDPALGLAQLITSLPNLQLVGIHAYAGHASHVIGWEERRKSSQAAMAPAVETARLFEKNGIECPLVTGGSTGTYNIDSSIKGITELQPGSFLFMDVDYARVGGKDGPVYQDFRTSLSVLTTVVSKPTDSLAVVDGGYKAFATDKPYTPEAKGIPGIIYTWGGDEHGKLDLAKAEAPVNLGDRIEFIVPHCDPSVNLYDRIHCVRGENVEAVWRIAARGMSQ